MSVYPSSANIKMLTFGVNCLEEGGHGEIYELFVRTPICLLEMYY